jgi:hypothetical protein
MQQQDEDMKEQSQADVTDKPIIVEGPGSAVAAFLNSPFVQELTSHSEPINEEQRVTIFLQGINRGKIRIGDWIQLATGTRQPGQDNQKDVPLPSDAETLEYYKRVLLATVSRPKGAAQSSDMQIIDNAMVWAESRVDGRLAAVPLVYTRPKDARTMARAKRNFEIKIEYTVIGLDTQASLDYSFALLLSKFSNRLRRCRYSACGDFFLEDLAAGRGKQREYCVPEHREPQLGLERVQGVQAKRAGVTVDQWRKLKAHDESMTPGAWKAIKGARLRLTPEQWIAEQQRKSK